jgi:hypothetical protein
MDYAQQGVLGIQLRVASRLKSLLGVRKMYLDPGPLVWFDGRMELPKPGELETHALVAVQEGHG